MPEPQIAALNNLAHLKEELSALVEAIRLTRDALETCTRIGDRLLSPALYNPLADLLYARQQPDKALAHQ